MKDIQYCNIIIKKKVMERGEEMKPCFAFLWLKDFAVLI